tara:strand:+ start:224 stop:568 length:345 start_codon:yes stop_codon:yes gene_type:complete
MAMAFLSMAALQVVAAPAMAQNIGDVGADSRGNIYTFVRDRTGRGVWMKGRTIPEPTTERRIQAERYTPTIWTDPDGCEHWVMDDGVEGFMTPHVTELGVPVCNQPPKTHRGKH